MELVIGVSITASYEYTSKVSRSVDSAYSRTRKSPVFPGAFLGKGEGHRPSAAQSVPA